MRSPERAIPFLIINAATAFSLVALPATAAAQTPPPAVTKAVESLLEQNSGREQTEACRAIRAALSSFIAEHKRPVWDKLAPPDAIDSPAKLRAKIEQLDDGRTIDEFVRHSTEFLLRYPEHPEFPERLWELAAIAASHEQNKRDSPLFDTSFLPPLLEGCSNLPDDNAYQLEGKLLEARHRHQMGDFEKEEQSLRELLEREDLPAPIRVASRSLLGRCLESQQRFDEALDLYAQAEDGLALYPQACDTTLRAALIHLNAGRRAEAEALLKKLAATDPALRKLSRSARDIDALLKLAGNPEGLSRYWDHADNWWPAWVALREKLGHPRPADELRVPDLADAHDAGRQLASAIASNNKAAFHDKLDLILHALRRTPSVIGEAGASLCFLAPRISPDQQDAIYEMVVKICDGFEPGDPDLLRSAQLYQTVAYSDTDRHDKALEVIEAFRAKDEKPDELSETMTRLWAHLSLAGEGRDLAGPRAALEKLLKADRRVQNRAQTVLYLAQIYGKLELADEEKELLARELENPEVKSDEAIAAGLGARLRGLTLSGGADEFSAAVVEWEKTHAPGWLRFALPKGLEDPRVKGKDLTELVDPSSRSNFSPEETVKLELLAAASDGLTLSAKDRAFRGAFAAIYADAPRHSIARKMLRETLRDDRFPEPLRQMLLIFSLDEALARGRKRDISNVITHPLLDQNNPRLGAAIQAYGRYSTTDLDSAKSLMDCYNELSNAEINSAELTVIAQVVERLLTIGAVDEADKIRGEIRAWELAPDVTQNKATLRLAFLQAIKRANGAIPFAEKMGELLTKHADLDSISPPPRHLDYRVDVDLKRLSEADAFALLVGRATQPAALQTSPGFWADLAEIMPRDDQKQVEFSFALLSALLEAELPDLEKSLTIFAAPSIIDTDDAALLDRLLALFDKHRDPKNVPFTHAAMRVVEIQSRDLRQGKEVDLHAAWRGLNHPSIDGILQPNKLRNLMARRDIPKLRSALELLPADKLLSPDLLDVTWPALEMAGMKDEAELAAEAAEELLPRYIAGAARTLNYGLVGAVYDTARQLGKPELVPEGWFEYLDSQVNSERDRYSLRIMEAERSGDWEGVAKWATRAVEEYPTYYNYYRPQGTALYHIGQKEKAIAALEVYTKYSKDEVAWKDSVELLKTLKSE